MRTRDEQLQHVCVIEFLEQTDESHKCDILVMNVVNITARNKNFIVFELKITERGQAKRE